VFRDGERVQDAGAPTPKASLAGWLLDRLYGPTQERRA
jgi:hypothetical protein